MDPDYELCPGGLLIQINRSDYETIAPSLVVASGCAFGNQNIFGIK